MSGGGKSTRSTRKVARKSFLARSSNLCEFSIFRFFLLKPLLGGLRVEMASVREGSSCLNFHGKL
jgi:hypothetical protein